MFQFHSLEAQSQDFLIIANNNVPRESFSSSELRRVFFGFTHKWDDNQKVKVAYIKSADIEPLWKSIRTTEAQFLDFWWNRVNSGNGVAPKDFDESTKLIDYVNRTSGAVGVIPAIEEGNLPDNCRIISFSE